MRWIVGEQHRPLSGITLFFLIFEGFCLSVLSFAIIAF